VLVKPPENHTRFPRGCQRPVMLARRFSDLREFDLVEGKSLVITRHAFSFRDDDGRATGIGWVR
jgi:hypothetical protein